MKLLLIVSADVDVTDELFIKYSSFVSYLREMEKYGEIL